MQYKSDATNTNTETFAERNTKIKT
jgi:hypothetical protein